MVSLHPLQTVATITNKCIMYKNMKHVTRINVSMQQRFPICWTHWLQTTRIWSLVYESVLTMDAGMKYLTLARRHLLVVCQWHQRHHILWFHHPTLLRLLLMVAQTTTLSIWCQICAIQGHWPLFLLWCHSDLTCVAITGPTVSQWNLSICPQSLERTNHLPLL